ncbi:RimK/LysX family protein [Candidatus Woesearchaeota archaeon]|nr:RimK/LysX family protein [Candidatus Woesearchaeota archaeon]MBW3015980.1 RimK/LysX family protein [Candidatus Woesearchaeota archaeon]
MKTIIGLTARVVLFGRKGKKEVVARIDTGATKSSMDKALAKELDIGPELKQAKVKSAHGVRYRPVVMADVMIAGELVQAEFTLAEREHMKYRMLIGQNILKKGFLIDPSKGVD